MFKYVLLICLMACTRAVDDDSHAHVEKDLKMNDGHGHFAYEFDITNGIGADEAGDEKKVTGGYHFITNDGKEVKVTYIADEQGFRAEGDVIPKPPPTPPAILRALEYIKSHPHAENRDNDKKQKLH